MSWEATTQGEMRIALGLHNAHDEGVHAAYIACSNASHALCSGHCGQRWLTELLWEKEATGGDEMGKGGKGEEGQRKQRMGASVFIQCRNKGSVKAPFT